MSRLGGCIRVSGRGGGSAGSPARISGGLRWCQPAAGGGSRQSCGSPRPVSGTRSRSSGGPGVFGRLVHADPQHRGEPRGPAPVPDARPRPRAVLSPAPRTRGLRAGGAHVARGVAAGSLQPRPRVGGAAEIGRRSGTAAATTLRQLLCSVEVLYWGLAAGLALLLAAAAFTLGPRWCKRSSCRRNGHDVPGFAGGPSLSPFPTASINRCSSAPSVRCSATRSTRPLP